MTTCRNASILAVMPPTSNVYRMANDRCDGRFAEVLQAHCEAGDSLNAISSALFAAHGIRVSVQTVSNWLKELGLETAKQKAKAS